MSGSSYSRPSFGGNFGSGEGSKIDNCLTIRMTTSVVSPDMSFFSTLSVGTILLMDLLKDIVVILNHSGQPVGSINPTRIEELKKCMEEHKFQATITELNGAYIQVLVQHA